MQCQHSRTFRYYAFSAIFGLITYADGRGVVMVFSGVCVSVYLYSFTFDFTRYLTKEMQQGSLNLTQTWSPLSRRNLFCCQRVKGQCDKFIAGVGLCTVVSAGVF